MDLILSRLVLSSAWEALEQPLFLVEPYSHAKIFWNFYWMPWVFSKISLICMTETRTSPEHMSSLILSSLQLSLQSPGGYIPSSFMDSYPPVCCLFSQGFNGISSEYFWSSFSLMELSPTITSPSHVSVPELWSVTSALWDCCAPDLPSPMAGQVNGRKPEWLHSHIICFLSLKDQNPALPVVQCLKGAVSCILSNLLVIHVRRACLSLFCVAITEDHRLVN